MKRFKYNYLQNTLAYQLIDEELNGVWYQISEEQQFLTSFGSSGFSLDYGWMTFTILSQSIKVFYKHSPEPLDLKEFLTEPKLTYYQKYLPKQPEIIFTFSEKDEVEKLAGKWVSKNN